MSKSLLVFLEILFVAIGYANGCQVFAQNRMEEAEKDFVAGRFDSAADAFESELSAETEQAGLHRLATIALLRNDLEATRMWLDKIQEKGLALEETDKKYAELYYRQKRFDLSADYFRKVGREAMADKLASFGDRVPYYRDPDQPKSVTIPFERRDPLPVVRLKVNNSDDVFAVIDTGGSELILDPEFASLAGATEFGAENSMFAGGKTADVKHARVDSIQMAGMTIENVPVRLLPTRRFAAAAGGLKIDAVIGTVLLKQFHCTLDYPGESLILSEETHAVHSSEDDSIEVPFFLASDHFIVANGAVNDSGPMMFFVDTGLAGQAFTCPQSTLDAAKINPSGPKFQGMGGGGKIDVQLFAIESLSLGNASRTGLTGLFGPFPESLEHGMEFRIGGLISHAFFRDYAVSFDFDAMLIRLTKPK